MSDKDQKPPEGNTPEQGQEDRPESSPPPSGKTFQIILVQTAVFAAVFFTIIWLVEDQPLIAAALGLAAIVYLIVKKKAG
ncbi:MAG: hypothetical protein COW19_04665 [Zetaproteobacteria bacterium CG12_big_fil_rev_8_21_14_0_65_55_1124]|nr:MAG: hypothetical protein AUJ58_01905 [Zetaproteobacteria bacterium CG1_02_55_237]PIS18340.1 MAG: hypothetical protein COT53_11480 [Zetaproteobacteria bacterium CG08_land_8_20_14_0_20_55_17]PIW43067.1 MAG: hypothetical protein COW19_04665 [Zetaproteobacteria bacterium CG12_big_fil_rev_8_21_14_0_65_55_1124]PIY52280.1 MAG: hypothetical protein COZ01_08440 [Zetaproteobacteria bacterium CG_4_10_14_0_8_um_filter_55_43]PIZ38772.1 MAG: hypothetical protein COY36_05305 [Zetaproteobacteria bacterium 